MSQDLERYLALLEYELALVEAEEDLLRFAEMTMPPPRYPDDPSKSKYIAGRHHRFMADTIMQVERGEKKKVIFNTPPRHGKTELCTKRFCAWYSARNPDQDIIVATYSEKFAQDFAKDVRDIIASPRFRQIFPEYHLLSQSNEQIRTYDGGDIFFLGRRSATTGRGANLIIVDDPTKDDKDVRYQTFREDCWQWFTQTLLTRRHDDQAALVLSQTRWHEDDIVGRLTDPTNPSFSKKLSEEFEVINLPAIAEADDALSRKPGEPLWPERFGIKYLDEMREVNPVSFASLYQCDPTPDEGVFFQVDGIHEYEPHELPQKLTMYCVSDHAVATSNINDPTCMIPFGICEGNNAWIMPQIAWRRMDAQDAVEEMIEMMRTYNPVFWYAEKGHITKAIGPFLHKRMMEEEVYTPVIEEHPVGDKVQRAQSGRARAAQGRIKFPKTAPWWPRAKGELLKFPNGRFDDFVDCISMIGMKVGNHVGPGREAPKSSLKKGTFGYMLKQFRESDIRDKAKASNAGW